MGGGDDRSAAQGDELVRYPKSGFGRAYARKKGGSMEAPAGKIIGGVRKGRSFFLGEQLRDLRLELLASEISSHDPAFLVEEEGSGYRLDAEVG